MTGKSSGVRPGYLFQAKGFSLIEVMMSIVLVAIGIIVPVAVLGAREYNAPTKDRGESMVERLVVKLGTTGDINAPKLFPDAEQAQAVLTRFGITDEGNWEERPGQTILERRSEAAIPGDAIDRMYVEREKRPKPMTDTKILSGWNGLMISAFARATR